MALGMPRTVNAELVASQGFERVAGVPGQARDVAKSGVTAVAVPGPGAPRTISTFGAKRTGCQRNPWPCTYTPEGLGFLC
jgi:hypothetical protein